MTAPTSPTLDPTTLLFTISVLGFATAAFALSSSRAIGAERSGLVEWGKAMSAVGAAFLLFFLRGHVPAFLTYVVANCIVLSAPAYGLLAHTRFFGIEPPRYTVGALVVFGITGLMAVHTWQLPLGVGVFTMSSAMAGLLGMTGDQSHGLMTNGSDRDEHRQIGPLGRQALGQGRRQFIAHPSRGVDPAHEGEGMFRQRTDHALFDQPTQGVDRENAVRIAPRIRLVVGKMRRPQIGGIHIRRNGPEGGVILEMEGDLARDIDASGSDQSDATLRQGLSQGLPWRCILIADPCIGLVT